MPSMTGPYTRQHLIRTLFAVRKLRVALKYFEATYSNMSGSVSDLAMSLDVKDIADFIVEHAATAVNDAGPKQLTPVRVKYTYKYRHKHTPIQGDVAFVLCELQKVIKYCADRHLRAADLPSKVRGNCTHLN